ncbi:putative tRNA pseudouridine synthase Pus10 [Agrilus planipennis]|uniref:tRNA pseudouridine(55) synthase n=1 Tax=Agrilus planipennis TaxID=224129 RepID=A0A7F5RE01_AGRPL|nr:putative tRNA pseudouridine synthase Pus10 [Agrilus planipennis]
MCEELKNQIIDHLLTIGCCKYCCLRYLNIRKEDSYLNIEQFMSDVKSSEETISIKRVRPNPCIACLGLLQDFVIDEIIQNVQLNTAAEYDSKTFTCSVSMPVNILLREHLVKIDLKRKFPDFYKDDTQETQLNKIWKVVIKNKLASKLNKTFQNSVICNFSVNIILDYEDEDQELKLLQKAAPNHFKTRTQQRKKYSGEIYTRKDILNLLSEIKDDNILKHCPVPPEVPLKWLKCKSIECKHNPIYFAGRYCKYSRELSQSPWIIDGVKTMETSVQEIIFNEIHKIFGIPLNNLKFTASGREDCDVRCLGRGRPFYIEINDPRVTEFSFEQFRTLEKAINLSKMIKVQDLQPTVREDLCQIKKGEETKTKQYIALCIVEGPVSDEKINILNQSAPLEIFQDTPIRVLHRRPLATRKKTIHEMKASRVPEKDNMFKLNVVTQAGTYIKEFVHGDFDRTVPNVCSLIGMEVDILALDVIAINLDWPKPINYENGT